MMEMAKLTNFISKQDMEMTKEKQLMNKKESLREEEMQVKQFHQIQRTKAILFDLNLKAEIKINKYSLQHHKLCFLQQ